MTIEKLPSGSYRIRQMDHGKLYTLTVKKKPSERVARQLIDEKIATAPPLGDMSMRVACAKYISAKKNVLSDTTVREYRRTARSLPEEFLELDISEIRDYEFQKVVNDLAADLNPKTVCNYYGFIHAVLRMFNPKVKYSVTLPQKRHTEPYTPSQDDVKRILEAVQDTDYYVPFYLAALSLRRSELCALTSDDLDGNSVVINKAYVESEDGWVIKPVPKNDASNRSVPLPAALADRIREQGYVFRYHPNQLNKKLHRIQKKLGIPSFPIHKMRHFFASYSHDLGYSDATIQAMGGWSTDNVMKRVYRHAMNESEVRKQITTDFTF